MSGGMSEIYQEGLRIPVMRLYRRGELDTELFELLLLNMRLPAERRGDLNAQIAACRLGVERMQQLFARYGTATVESAFGQILDRTAKRMRAGIAAIPDGSYRFEDVLDDDGLKERNVKFALEVRKAGERIVFDFTGSSPQVPGNVNLTLNAVQSCVCYALKALLDPELPNNQAAIDAVEIVAPAGTVANCVAPAAGGAAGQHLPARHRRGHRRAGRRAARAGDRGGQRRQHQHGVRRHRPAQRRALRLPRDPGGGMGGRNDRDGKDGVQVHITNTSNLPVEAIEMEYPLRVEEYALVADSGGAGRFRGGMGLRRSVRPVGHTCEFNGVGERFRLAPWGIFGGEPGLRGRFQLQRRRTVTLSELPPKTGRMELGPDQAVIVETPGAGGYGPARERSPADVERDRRSGKFSARTTCAANMEVGD